MFVTNSSTTTAWPTKEGSAVAVALWSVLRCGRPARSHLISHLPIQSFAFQASHPSSTMPSARIVVAVLYTRRPGKQHHIPRVSRQLACRNRDNPSCQTKGLQVGGLTRLMCSRYVGQRPNCSTIDPPSERAMPAAAAVSREARCSAACILVVHGADHADQPVSSAAETLFSIGPVG